MIKLGAIPPRYAPNGVRDGENKRREERPRDVPYDRPILDAHFGERKAEVPKNPYRYSHDEQREAFAPGQDEVHTGKFSRNAFLRSLVTVHAA